MKVAWGKSEHQRARVPVNGRRRRLQGKWTEIYRSICCKVGMAR